MVRNHVSWPSREETKETCARRWQLMQGRSVPNRGNSKCRKQMRSKFGKRKIGRDESWASENVTLKGRHQKLPQKQSSSIALLSPVLLFVFQLEACLKSCNFSSPKSIIETRAPFLWSMQQSSHYSVCLTTMKYLKPLTLDKEKVYLLAVLGCQIQDGLPP